MAMLDGRLGAGTRASGAIVTSTEINAGGSHRGVDVFGVAHDDVGSQEEM